MGWSVGLGQAWEAGLRGMTRPGWGLQWRADRGQSRLEPRWPRDCGGMAGCEDAKLGAAGLARSFWGTNPPFLPEGGFEGQLVVHRPFP